MPHIVLMEKENTINCEDEQQNKRDDSIKKSINTVFSTNIEHMVNKESNVIRKSSKELIN